MNFCIIFNEKMHLENKQPVNGIYYLKNQVERPLSHKISNFIILSLLQVMVSRDWIDVFSQEWLFEGNKNQQVYFKNLKKSKNEKEKQYQKSNVQLWNYKTVILYIVVIQGNSINLLISKCETKS